MKKVKIALWIIVFGFIGLIIYQNREFFMAESRLVINLVFFYYETPYLANAIFFVAFFLFGILLSYFFSLFKHFRDTKTIKALKAKEASLVETVAALEKQVAACPQPTEPDPEPEAPAQEEPVEMVTDAK